jgi:hypothetical protein
MLNRVTVRGVAIAAVICATLSAQAATPKKKAKPTPKPAAKALHIEQAYFAGHLVKFHSADPSTGRALIVGPWNLGPRISPGPSDKRPNLYFVSPGTQHQVPGHPDFDHNEVLSAVPDDESDFDVFWVVVLDPSVKEDFTSEQQIILATQQTFVPADDFAFDQIPSAGFLKTFLKKTDIDGLEKLRRPDGGLPKVAIVRAGITVRATAEEIPEPVQADSDETKKAGE